MASWKVLQTDNVCECDGSKISADFYESRRENLDNVEKIQKSCFVTVEYFTVSAFQINFCPPQLFLNNWVAPLIWSNGSEICVFKTNYI